ncbi:hypothetical protein [Streptomyces sp. NPDC002851]
MPLAVEFLDGKGFNLVTIVLAVVAVVLGGISAYYARKTLFPPKRQLTYSLESVIALVNRAGLGVGGAEIEVRRNGELLNDPHLAAVRLKNTGRHDIDSQRFDRERPLELDLNVPIKELLSATNGERDSVMDGCTVTGTTLTFGPELISRSRPINFVMLVENVPTLEVRAHLVDVKLRRASSDGARTRMMRTLVELSATGSGAAAAAALARLLS